MSRFKSKVKKSVTQERLDIELATKLIKLGARLQVLQDYTTVLSYDRLTHLFHEVTGRSPTKGLLPFSPDWYIHWLANINSTIFYSYYRRLFELGGLDRAYAFIKAYRLYLEHEKGCEANKKQRRGRLDVTRAWTLLRFMDSKMLEVNVCKSCRLEFITHANEYGLHQCVICSLPSRAGSSLK